MKTKTKILLVWNDKQGKFRKYFLVPALRQNVEGEDHYTAEMPTGEWL